MVVVVVVVTGGPIKGHMPSPLLLLPQQLRPLIPFPPSTLLHHHTTIYHYHHHYE